MVENLKIKMQDKIKCPVELANGKKHYTRGYIENLSFALNETNHIRNFFVVDMGEQDVIIRMDWLVSKHALIVGIEHLLSLKESIPNTKLKSLKKITEEY